MKYSTRVALEDKAWRLGTNYGKRACPAGLETEVMYQTALQDGWPLQCVDVFMDAAQKVWRQKGEI